MNQGKENHDLVGMLMASFLVSIVGIVSMIEAFVLALILVIVK